MFDIVSGGVEWKSTQPKNKINHSNKERCVVFTIGVIVLMSMIGFSYIFLC